MKQDQWLKAIAWKINNKKVVHHATLYFMADQLKFDAAKKIENGLVLDATSPARPPLIFPKDTGILLTKGTQFFFELHYTSSGKQEKDLTQVGLYFYKTPPPKVFLLRFIKDRDFVIPPRVKEWKIKGSSFTKHDVAFYGFRPHAHWRGKKINLRIRYLDETVEEVLNVPYYKFLWQTRYLLKEPMHLPAGTRMEVEAVYDNSFQNLDNPNPDRTLRFGEQSQDEMFEEEFYFVEE